MGELFSGIDDTADEGLQRCMIADVLVLHEASRPEESHASVLQKSGAMVLNLCTVENVRAALGPMYMLSPLGIARLFRR